MIFNAIWLKNSLYYSQIDVKTHDLAVERMASPMLCRCNTTYFAIEVLLTWSLKYYLLGHRSTTYLVCAVIYLTLTDFTSQIIC